MIFDICNTTARDSVRINNVTGRHCTLNGIRTLRGKTGFEIMSGDSVLREVREVLRNCPEVSYFNIILFGGTCAFAKFSSFWAHLANEGRKFLLLYFCILNVCVLCSVYSVFLVPTGIL